MIYKIGGLMAVVALVAFFISGMLLGAAAQTGTIFVKLMQCPTLGAVSHMPGNWPQFETIDNAKNYADRELNNSRARIAYVHQEIAVPGGTRSELVAVRATGDCYAPYRQWTTP